MGARISLPSDPCFKRVSPESRQRSYLGFVASLPCVVTGSTRVQVHHLIHHHWPDRVRRDDRMVLPLRHDLHAALHDVWGDERAFFDHYGIDGPYTTAAMLWTLYDGLCSTDDLDAAARRVLMEARR